MYSNLSQFDAAFLIASTVTKEMSHRPERMTKFRKGAVHQGANAERNDSKTFNRSNRFSLYKQALFVVVDQMINILIEQNALLGQKQSAIAVGFNRGCRV